MVGAPSGAKQQNPLERPRGTSSLLLYSKKGVTTFELYIRGGWCCCSPAVISDSIPHAQYLSLPADRTLHRLPGCAYLCAGGPCSLPPLFSLHGRLTVMLARLAIAVVTALAYQQQQQQEQQQPTKLERTATLFESVRGAFTRCSSNLSTWCGLCRGKPNSNWARTN